MDEYRGTHEYTPVETINTDLIGHGGMYSQYYDYDEVSKIDTDLGPVWLTGLRRKSQFDEISEIMKFDFVISFTDKFHVDLSSDETTHIAYDIDDIEDPTEAAKFKEMLDEFYPFLDRQLKANKKVLIHCTAGVSRSPTSIIAYLIYRDNLSGKKASLMDYLEYMKSRRSCVCPNTEFLKLLDSLILE